MTIRQNFGQTEILKPLQKYSATQVKLPAGSQFKLGAIWWVLTSDLYYTTSSPAANTLYAVYAYNNAGTIALTASTTMPSAIGAGYKLVGAYWIQSDLTITEVVNTTVGINAYLGVITTTGSWTATYTGKYWRKEDMLIASIAVTLTAIPSTIFSLTCPFTLDTLKIAVSAGAYDEVGTALLLDVGTAAHRGFMNTSNSTTFGISAINSFTSPNTFWSGGVLQTSPFTWASGDEMVINYKVPIVGWSNLSVSEL